MHVLFICTGNICRSPTAERLALAYAVERGIPGFSASSAGTRAVISRAMHDEAALVLEHLGGDATGFSARQLNARIASDADLVLTMTRRHRDDVLEVAPQKLARTFTLREASRLATERGASSISQLPLMRSELTADKDIDIADPIGQSAEVFSAVGRQIAALLPPVMELCRRQGEAERS